MEPSEAGEAVEPQVLWKRVDSAGGDIPTAEGLHGHSMIHHEGKLYIFGGASHGYSSDAFYIFDLETHLWRAITPPGDALLVSADHEALHCGNFMLIYGALGVSALCCAFFF